MTTALQGKSNYFPVSTLLDIYQMVKSSSMGDNFTSLYVNKFFYHFFSEV